MFPPKYRVPLTPRAIAPTLKWERSARAQAAAGQQGESQRVFVQPRCLFKRRDLICRQQGGEMRIRQNRSRADCKFSAS